MTDYDTRYMELLDLTRRNEAAAEKIKQQMPQARRNVRIMAILVACMAVIVGIQITALVVTR